MKTEILYRQATAHRPRRGFTLAELLVVLTIVSILFAATVPAVQGMMQSTTLTEGGQTLVGLVNQARQLASSRNMAVQVRLIKLAQVNNSSATGYNAIQLWGTPSGSSAPVALNKMIILPGAVAISQDTTNYSKLLAATGAVLATGTMTLPSGSASYTAFSVMPSGMIPVTSVSMGQATQMQGAYLSVVPAYLASTSIAPGTTGAPSNYIIVQLNPDTGSAVVYRP